MAQGKNMARRKRPSRGPPVIPCVLMVMFTRVWFMRPVRKARPIVTSPNSSAAKNETKGNKYTGRFVCSIGRNSAEEQSCFKIKMRFQ